MENYFYATAIVTGYKSSWHEDDLDPNDVECIIYSPDENDETINIHIGTHDDILYGDQMLISLTPAQARDITAALLKAANEVEES